MKVSQQVLEWQAEAEVKTRRADLLAVLQEHCGSKVPVDLFSAIQSNENLEQLACWFNAALKARSYDEFRTVLGL